MINLFFHYKIFIAYVSVIELDQLIHNFALQFSISTKLFIKKDVNYEGNLLKCSGERINEDKFT